jgi:thiamine-monophosphate kinase
MDEFALIRKYFAPLAKGAPFAFDLADDAAAIRPKPGFDLIVSTDMLVEGVHIRAGLDPALIARKLIRVNLSDLAAKGARPFAYLLAAAVPKATKENWFAAFAAALGEEQARFGLDLLGGDTTAAETLVLDVTVFGEVPQGRMLRRDAAKPGDLVFVSNTIGDGAFGLLASQGRLKGVSSRSAAALRARLDLPEPRVALGLRLRDVAHACIDVSDGLLQDLGHIAGASNVRIVIDLTRVPLSAAAQEALALVPDGLMTACTGGDDYELAFTLPSDRADAVASLAGTLGLAITPIGHVAEGSGVGLIGPKGPLPWPEDRAGFRHRFDS